MCGGGRRATRRRWFFMSRGSWEHNSGHHEMTLPHWLLLYIFCNLKLSGLAVCCCHNCHLHIPYSLIKIFSGFLTSTAVLRPLLPAPSFPKHHIIKSCQIFLPKALISPETSHHILYLSIGV